MARIRTIKPEFWCDEKLSPLSAIDRLTFLGLISMADDYGRVHDNVKIIDAFVFPNSDDSVRESLANLSRIIRIRRGISSSGMAIIEIVNWDRHQKVDKPQPKLALPAIDPTRQKTQQKQGSNAVLESFANDSRTARELVAPHTPTPTPTPTNDLRPTTVDQVANATTRTNRKFEKPTLEEVQTYCDQTAITIDVELFVDHYSAQGWKLSNGRAMVDWRAAARKWAKNDRMRPQNQPTTFAQQRVRNTMAAIDAFVGEGGA